MPFLRPHISCPSAQGLSVSNGGEVPADNLVQRLDEGTDADAFVHSPLAFTCTFLKSEFISPPFPINTTLAPLPSFYFSENPSLAPRVGRHRLLRALPRPSAGRHWAFSACVPSCLVTCPSSPPDSGLRRQELHLGRLSRHQHRNGDTEGTAWRVYGTNVNDGELQSQLPSCLSDGCRQRCGHCEVSP